MRCGIGQTFTALEKILDEECETSVVEVVR